MFVVLAVGIFIVPQIAFAAWWNPFTWNIFIFNKAPKTQVQQVQNATTTQNSDTKTSTTKKETVKSSTSANKTTNKIPDTTLSNSQIIKKVKPAVVYIETDTGTGSGMIISSDGFVLTNAHVVQNSTAVKITLSGGGNYSATIVGRDENVDLAVLKINAQNLAKVEFGDSDMVEQGDEVFTLGYPFGIKGDVSFKEGTISREIADGANTYLETSAEMLPGNSGGPLVNAWGKVIGVNSASFGQSIKGIAVGETIKFAIPINIAKNLIPELKAGRQVIAPKIETPAVGDPFQAGDSNLKIAKCQADKQSRYDQSVAKLEAGIQARLSEVYNSLNKQYQDSAKQVADRYRNDTERIMSDSTLTGDAKLELMRKNSAAEQREIDLLYQNQQIFWKNQKAEIEGRKQQAVNEISALLSTEYSKCINQ